MLFLLRQKLPNYAAARTWFDPCADGRRGAGPADFARLVGPAGWARLPPAIRARFGRPVYACERFEGRMIAVEASRVGLLFAGLARLIGTPLAPHRGRDVPVTIELRPEFRGAGVVWDREYRFPDRRPILVTSTKRLASNGDLLECVGGGFGMSLDVFKRDRALHFVSRRYFWRVGRTCSRLVGRT
jgi:hypothetical protein